MFCGTQLTSVTDAADQKITLAYTSGLPYGKRGIMVRIMESSGGYYRISIPGKETFDVSGYPSTSTADTHIPIRDSSPQDIEEIIASIIGDL